MEHGHGHMMNVCPVIYIFSDSWSVGILEKKLLAKQNSACTGGAVLFAALHYYLAIKR